jgi:hypothetical protein
MTLSRRLQSGARKALAMMTAALTACSNVSVEEMTPRRATEVTQKNSSVVLMRFVGRRADKPFMPIADTRTPESPRVVFRNLDLGTTFRSVGDLEFPAPSKEAASAGWTHFVLPPGSYYLALHTPQRVLGTPTQNLSFTVPDHSSVTYVGTLFISCTGSTDANYMGSVPWPCEPEAQVRDETSEAAEVAARYFAGIGPLVTELALPYARPSPGGELPPPVSPEIVLTPGEWLLRPDGDDSVRKTSTTSSASGGGGGSLLNGCGGPGCGALLLLIIVAAGVIYAVHELSSDETEGKLKACASPLADAGSAAESLKSRLSREPADRSIADSAAAQQPASARWEASLTRVMLRKCLAPHSYGIEVAARWRALESGPGRARFDAVLVRAPQGAAFDKRVSHPWAYASALPAWEVQMPTPSPCRPIADYCAPNGSDLALQDIVDGFSGMQEWLAQHASASPAFSASAPLIMAPAR